MNFFNSFFTAVCFSDFTMFLVSTVAQKQAHILIPVSTSPKMNKTLEINLCFSLFSQCEMYQTLSLWMLYSSVVGQKKDLEVQKSLI